MNKHEFIIGIDPDCEKSGMVILSTLTQKVDVYSMPFPHLLDFLKSSKDVLKSIVVVVEAGWLNQTHWHVNPKDSRLMAAAKGNSVGRNHETGRKIVEMCKHYDIDVVEIRPLKKCWSGPEGKITQEEISQFIPGFPGRSNQEVRDAALIAWTIAGFPIKIKPVKPIYHGNI